ncbi:hypothetical protein ACWCV9_21575 [Streptomyces sp. NPDC001606]
MFLGLGDPAGGVGSGVRHLHEDRAPAVGTAGHIATIGRPVPLGLVVDPRQNRVRPDPQRVVLP